jgi:hypothetical protein
MANRKTPRAEDAGSRISGGLEDVPGTLDAVLESSYDGIYITDGNADTIKINSSYETISVSGIIVQSEEVSISICIDRIKNILKNILPALIPALFQTWGGQLRTRLTDCCAVGA